MDLQTLKHRPKRLMCFIVSLLLLTIALPSFAEFREVMIPMRDGTKLATNISIPDGQGPWPIILTRTPYNKDGRGARPEGRPQEQGQDFLDAGYVYVIQDVRGQFKSEGEYQAWVHDMNDGYDTIEWLTQQPFSDGKVAVYGASATGITANLAVMSLHPAIKAGYAIVAHGSAYHYSTYPNGAYLRAMVEDWSAGRGVARPQVPRPIMRTINEGDELRNMANYYDKIKVPMLNKGGWYDIFLQGNIDNFMGLQYHGSKGAKGNQKLVLGAFGHGALKGDLQYPKDAGQLRGDRREVTRFFDHWLKGKDTGFYDEPAIRYYVMGDAMSDAGDVPGNEWRTSDSWPPKSTSTPLYLSGNGKLAWEKSTIAGKQSQYKHDPNNPIPSVGGNNLTIALGPMDQREVSSRSDVLKFETDVLDNPVEVIGNLSAKLYVSSSAEDTDFYVKLVDVYPNGYEALIMDQGTRLRFRDGVDKMLKAKPGEIYELDIDLWSTGIIFNKGHKIAVHIQSSNFNRFDNHSNTWEPVLDFSKDAVVATNTIHHTDRHPSAVTLPITKIYTKE
ncbi:CocE/NonD family hydrolase [Aurantivibrio plasticivorans]